MSNSKGRMLRPEWQTGSPFTNPSRVAPTTASPGPDIAIIANGDPAGAQLCQAATSASSDPKFPNELGQPNFGATEIATTEPDEAVLQPCDGDGGSSEIAAPPGSGLLKVTEAFDAARSGEGMFRPEAGLTAVLARAFALYIALQQGGPAALEWVLAHPSFEGRERRPKKTNLSYLAVHVAAKPRDDAQRKCCSEYCARLEHAADTNVAPEGFEEFLAACTLARSKQYVRQKRRESRPSKRDESGSSPVESAHTYRFSLMLSGHGTAKELNIVDQIPAGKMARLGEIIDELIEGRSAASVFSELAQLCAGGAAI